MENTIAGVWFVGALFFMGAFNVFANHPDQVGLATVAAIFWPVSLVMLVGAGAGMLVRKVIGYAFN